MRILITIPTWNEATTIERTLAELSLLAKTILRDHEVTIEVADNGSTDGTLEKIQISNLKSQISTFHLSARGKGLAIRRSWERHLEDADILLFTDADLAADLSIVPTMVHLIERGDADIVCGSRFVAGALVSRRAHRELASRLYRFLQRLILRLPVADAQCGLKVISASAAGKLLPLCRETGWMFDSELLFLAKKTGVRMTEVPVSWVEHRDPARRSALRVFRDGWGFLLGLARIATH